MYSGPLKILALGQRKLLEILYTPNGQIAQLFPVEGTPKCALTGDLKRL
jgi:hypothetical protein